MMLPELLSPLVMVHAYWMPWTGDPTRVSRPVGYVQNDHAVIESQVMVMKSAGITGVIAAWQGAKVNAWTHSAFTKMFYTCLTHGMNFMVLLDPWIAKEQPDPTGAVIEQLRSPFFQELVPFLNDQSGDEDTAERYVLEFDLHSSAGVDVDAVRAACPELEILSKHVGYSWIELGDPLGTLERENKNPAMRVPGLFWGFNDGGYPLPSGVSHPQEFKGERDWNRSVWGEGKARIVDPQAGKLFQGAAALVPQKAKFAGLITWNDYDEGTALEPFAVIGAG